NSDTISVPEDAVNFPITLTASDVDSLVLSFNAPEAVTPQHGTLSCLGDSCTYSPALNYNGPDSFTFSVSDGDLTSIGTITINVTAEDDAPVATDQSLTTDEDVSATTTLEGTDVDDAPSSLTVQSVSNPTHGSANLAGPGPNDVTYLGDLNFNGIDSFTFVI